MHALYTFTFFSERVALILSADHCLIAFWGSDDLMNSCCPDPTDKLRLRFSDTASFDFLLDSEGDDIADGAADADDPAAGGTVAEDADDDEFKGGEFIGFLSSLCADGSGAAAEEDDDEGWGEGLAGCTTGDDTCLIDGAAAEGQFPTG